MTTKTTAVKKPLRCRLGFHKKIRVRNPNMTRALTARGLSPRQYLDNYSTSKCSHCGDQYIPAKMSITGKEMWIPSYKAVN